MNKNTLTGILLIGVILIGFTIYSSREQERLQALKKQELVEQQRRQEREDSIRRAQAAAEAPALDVPAAPARVTAVEAPRAVADESLPPALQAAVAGEPQFYTVKNNHLTVRFSNRGGKIESVQLNRYKTHDGEPVVLFDSTGVDFSFVFFAHKAIATSSFFFTAVDVPESTELSETDSVATLTFRLATAENASIDYIYTLRYDSYMIDLAVRMNGMNTVIPQKVTTLDLHWSATLRRQEKDFAGEANYSTVAYKYPNESDIEELSERSEAEDEKIVTRVEWVAFKQQFFSSILVAPNYFTNGSVAYTASRPGNAGGHLMHCEALMHFPYNNAATLTIPLQFYFGPNHYRTLQAYERDFGQLVPLGGWFIRPINRWLIIPTFHFLNTFISNYGLIILLLTIFIKIILAPFSQKSIVSSAKMKLLKPEVDKLNAKYPKQEDAMKKQQDMMALYKRYGVSMMGGCLPMLLQMPILFAMFRFFPASFELRQEGFLWANDFSTYDSILQLPVSIPMYGDHVSLFALLMAVSTFFYSKMMLSQTPQTGQPGMKFMQLYFMPVFLLVLCNNFSSGLSYYYMLSNFITMIQTWAIRRFFIDEKKMFAKMQARAAQPQKKSKFQQRLEAISKQQQQQARRKR
jgi:YidC/Oxa1 family membrane protein insertase